MVPKSIPIALGISSLCVYIYLVAVRYTIQEDRYTGEEEVEREREEKSAKGQKREKLYHTDRL